MRAARLTILLAILAMLGACAPVVEENVDRPLVATINAPADDRVFILAEELEGDMTGVAGCCSFSFMRPAPIRFQETHRNMFGSRAVPSAADLARNLTADLALLVSAPVFERELVEVDGGREVHGTVQLLAMVVDAETEEVLARVPGATYRDFRFVPSGESIPENLEEDVTMRALVQQAASDLAPTLVDVLEEIAAEWRAEDAATRPN